MTGETYVLVGMMGCGKSTLGRLLGKRLGVDFHDADGIFEAEAGMAISEFFRIHGEEAFRCRERELLERLADMPRGRIISAGGGAFCQPDTKSALLEKTVTVFLRVEEEELIRRLATSDMATRPVLGGAAWRQRVRELVRDRYPHYEQAHLVLDVGREKPAETVERLTRIMDERHKAGQGSREC